MKATLYCVATRKENAFLFPSFLFLSREEQTAALASEMQPQLIPPLWAWVRAIGNVWWVLTSLDITQGWRGCWETELHCKREHPKPHNVTLAPLSRQPFLVTWISFTHKGQICSSQVIFRALLLQKNIYMCNKSTARKNIHDVTNIFLTIPHRGIFYWPCSSCSFPQSNQSLFGCYPNYRDKLQPIMSCLCSGHSPLLLPKKASDFEGYMGRQGKTQRKLSPAIFLRTWHAVWRAIFFFHRELFKWWAGRRERGEKGSRVLFLWKLPNQSLSFSLQNNILHNSTAASASKCRGKKYYISKT